MQEHHTHNVHRRNVEYDNDVMQRSMKEHHTQNVHRRDVEYDNDVRQRNMQEHHTQNAHRRNDELTKYERRDRQKLNLCQVKGHDITFPIENFCRHVYTSNIRFTNMFKGKFFTYTWR